MNKIEKIIADATECAQGGQPWTQDRSVVYGLNVDDTGIDFDYWKYATHIVNTQPSYIIPILKSFLEMREALEKSANLVEQASDEACTCESDPEGYCRYCGKMVKADHLSRKAILAADTAMEGLP